MRRWMLLCSLLLILPAQANQDLREINAASKAWDSYAELSSRRDPRSVETLASSTLRHFGFIRDAALYASAEQLRRTPLPDRAMILALRATQNSDALKALDDAGVARLCIEQGYFGVPAPAEGASPPGVSHVTLLDADHAISELAPPSGVRYNFGSELVRESGAWKVAPESMIADQAMGLQQQAQSAGLKDEVMTARITSYLLGNPADFPNIIVLERPLLDDGMARARLTEIWPDYERTYKARIGALSVKAEAGDSTAQNALGTLLITGSLPKAAPKDEARGWKLLEQASEGGHTDAAWMVAQHLGGQMKIYDEAVLTKVATHLQRAANAGNAQAMLILGTFHLDGAAGLALDCRQAAALQARAEEAGVKEARNDQVWTWATCPIPTQRDPVKALQLAEYMVRQQDSLSASALDTVAATYAANRQFEQAVQFQRLALQKSSEDAAMNQKGRKLQLKRMQARLRDYQNGRDYVQQPGALKEMIESNR